MATSTKKTTKGNDRNKHSAFEGPTIGQLYPKGTTFKKNPNGTVTPILPGKNNKK